MIYVCLFVSFHMLFLLLMDVTGMYQYMLRKMYIEILLIKSDAT